MKKKLFSVILCVLGISLLAGFTLGGSGLREYYTGLLEQGIITEAEYEKLEAYGFELPESEKEPLDDFQVGSISTEMQLPADAGGPPHGGNHPPVGPLTLRGGATMGESEKVPLDDFVIGEIAQGIDGSVVSR